MFRNTKASGLTAIALSLASSVAAAATISDTASYTSAVSAQLLELDRFNPSLGTLNSVTLTFNGSIAGRAGVTNTSAALNLNTVQVSLFGSLIASAAPGAPAALDAEVGVIPTGTFLGSRTFTILGPGAITSTGVFTLSGLSVVQTFGGADLPGFVGTGTFGYSFASTADASVPSRFTSVQLTPSAISSGLISISYDYTPGAPVPLPGSLVFALSGVGVTGLALRKSKRPSRAA